MAGKLYGYPVLGRFGLGHSLPGWARCVVWTRAVGAEMLAPPWLQIRIGPYIRRERDKRDYHRHFSNDGYITGLRKAYIMATAKHVLSGPDSPSGEWHSNRDGLVLFRNLVGNNDRIHFHNFVKEHRLLWDELKRITRPPYHPKPFTRPTVAIHVRLGDFFTPDPAALAGGKAGTRIPLSWYLDTFAAVRATFAMPFDTVLYSDGSDEELQPLLEQEGVRRAPQVAAITDMLGIAQSDLLIASGSGFSHWGRFLGQVPAICYPGQLRLKTNHTGLEIERAAGVEFPGTFISGVEQRIAQSR